MNKMRISIFFLVVSFLAFSACKSNKHAAISQKNAKMLSEYVAAYTNGVVSRAKPIVVKFTNPQDVEEGSTANAEILTITPRVKGELIWKDASTLAFIPEGLLPADKKFRGELHLSKLVPNVSKELAVVPFEFATKPLHGSLSVEPPALDVKTKQFNVNGWVAITDVVPDEEVEQLLSVKGNGKYEIEWAHGNTHKFVVKGMAQAKKAYDVDISWNGRKLKMENLDAKVTIPQKGVFEVLKIQRNNSSVRPSFKVYFTDLVSKKQGLSGFVTVKGYTGDFSYWIDGSVLTVTPDDVITGRYKVAINKGLISTSNAKLAKTYTTTLEFEKREPQLRLAGRGVIVPRSGSKIYFPFEAVALKYVNVEVFKIFSNNVLQFLQVNEPDGMSDLQRVGRIIYQKKMALSAINPEADASIWTRYALDLSGIIDQDPNAIYQVRLAFRLGYGTTDCEEFDASEEADKVNWIGFKKQFFSAILATKTPFSTQLTPLEH